MNDDEINNKESLGECVWIDWLKVCLRSTVFNIVTVIIMLLLLITNNQWFEESFSTGVLEREFDKTTPSLAGLIDSGVVIWGQ